MSSTRVTVTVIAALVAEIAAYTPSKYWEWARGVYPSSMRGTITTENGRPGRMCHRNNLVTFLFLVDLIESENPPSTAGSLRAFLCKASGWESYRSTDGTSHVFKPQKCVFVFGGTDQLEDMAAQVGILGLSYIMCCSCRTLTFFIVLICT